MNFKIGDKVKILHGCSGTKTGEEAVLMDGTRNGNNKGSLHAVSPTCLPNEGCTCNNYWQLIDSSNQNYMSNILDFFRNLTATEDEKLLKECGLENPIGTPTAEGLALSAELSYKANRQAIIDLAKAFNACSRKSSLIGSNGNRLNKK